MNRFTHEELSPTAYDDEWRNFAAQVSASMLTASFHLALEGVDAPTRVLEELLVRSQSEILDATEGWQAPRQQRVALFCGINSLVLSGSMRLGALDACSVPESLALRTKRAAIYERAHEHWRQNADFAGSGPMCNAAIYRWFVEEERAGGRHVDEFDLRTYSDLAQIHHAPHTVRNLGGAAYHSSVKV